MPLVVRNKKWFEREHPFVRMERKKDPYAQERAAQKAARAQEENTVPQTRAKKIRAGEPGSQARRECDLNRLYDLEKYGDRSQGRCTYYQIHQKPPATVCKTSWFCRGCNQFMHPECFSDYHRVRHGVLLDIQADINKVRSSRKMLRKLPEPCQGCT